MPSNRARQKTSRPPLAPASYALFLALTAYGLALFGLGPCLTSIAATFRVELAATGGLYTAFFTGFIAGVLAAGYAAERLGKRRVVLAGLAILTGGMLLLAASPGPFAQPRFWWALASMVVMGVGGASVEATSSALVADANPRREAFALNLMQAFFGFGAIAGPLVVAAALARGWGWQTHFLVAAGFATAVLAALAVTQTREQPAAPLPLRDLGELLRRPALLALCGAMALYVGAEIGYTGWISALIQERLGAPAALAGMGVTAFWVMMTVGRLACTWLTEVLTRRSLMLVLAIGGAVASAATAVAPSPLWGIAAAGIVGFFYSGLFAVILTASSDRFSQRRVVVFSLIMTSVGIGGMTLPLAMGLLGDVLTLRWAMALPAAAMGALAVLFARIEAKPAQPRPVLSLPNGPSR
jgi:FHS family glucose/mannose:H+ symporter-like MFS transporter